MRERRNKSSFIVHLILNHCILIDFKQQSLTIVHFSSLTKCMFPSKTVNKHFAIIKCQCFNLNKFSLYCNFIQRMIAKISIINKVWHKSWRLKTHRDSLFYKAVNNFSTGSTSHFPLFQHLIYLDYLVKKEMLEPFSKRLQRRQIIN